MWSRRPDPPNRAAAAVTTGSSHSFTVVSCAGVKSEAAMATVPFDESITRGVSQFSPLRLLTDSTSGEDAERRRQQQEQHVGVESFSRKRHVLGSGGMGWSGAASGVDISSIGLIPGSYRSPRMLLSRNSTSSTGTLGGGGLRSSHSSFVSKSFKTSELTAALSSTPTRKTFVMTTTMPTLFRELTTPSHTSSPQKDISPNSSRPSSAATKRSVSSLDYSSDQPSKSSTSAGTTLASRLLGTGGSAVFASPAVVGRELPPQKTLLKSTCDELERALQLWDADLVTELAQLRTHPLWETASDSVRTLKVGAASISTTDDETSVAVLQLSLLFACLEAEFVTAARYADQLLPENDERDGGGRFGGTRAAAKDSLQIPPGLRLRAVFEGSLLQIGDAVLLGESEKGLRAVVTAVAAWNSMFGTSHSCPPTVWLARAVLCRRKLDEGGGEQALLMETEALKNALNCSTTCSSSKTFWRPLGPPFKGLMGEDSAALRLAQLQPHNGLSVFRKALSKRNTSPLLLVGVTDWAWTAGRFDVADYYVKKLVELLPSEKTVRLLTELDPLELRQCKEDPLAEAALAARIPQVQRCFLSNPLLLVQSFVVTARQAAQHMEFSQAEGHYCCALMLAGLDPLAKRQEGYDPPAFAPVSPQTARAIARALVLCAVSSGNEALWRRSADFFKTENLELEDTDCLYTLGLEFSKMPGNEDVSLGVRLLELVLRRLEGRRKVQHQDSKGSSALGATTAAAALASTTISSATIMGSSNFAAKNAVLSAGHGNSTVISRGETIADRSSDKVPGFLPFSSSLAATPSNSGTFSTARLPDSPAVLERFVAEKLLRLADKCDPPETMAKWRALRLLCTLDLRAAGYRLQLGQIYERLNMNLKAQQFYSRAIKLGGGPPAILALASLLFKQKDYECALEQFQRLESTQYDGGVSLLTMYAETLEHCAAGLNAQSERAETLWRKAHQVWIEIVTRDAEHLVALFKAGTVSAQRPIANFEQAELLMRRFLNTVESRITAGRNAADDHNVCSMKDRAALLVCECIFLSGKATEAMQWLNTMTSAAARLSGRGRLLQTVCWLRLGDCQKSAESAKQLQRFCSEDSDLEPLRIWILVESLLTARRFTEAATAADTATATSPGSALVYLAATWAALASGKPVQTKTAETAARAVALADCEVLPLARLLDTYCAFLVCQQQQQQLPNSLPSPIFRQYAAKCEAIREIFDSMGARISETAWPAANDSKEPVVSRPCRARWWLGSSWEDAVKAYIASVCVAQGEGDRAGDITGSLVCMQPVLVECRTQLRNIPQPRVHSWAIETFNDHLSSHLPQLHRSHIPILASTLYRHVLLHTPSSDLYIDAVPRSVPRSDTLPDPPLSDPTSNVTPGVRPGVSHAPPPTDPKQSPAAARCFSPFRPGEVAPHLFQSQKQPSPTAGAAPSSVASPGPIQGSVLGASKVRVVPSAAAGSSSLPGDPPVAPAVRTLPLGRPESPPPWSSQPGQKPPHQQQPPNQRRQPVSPIGLRRTVNESNNPPLHTPPKRVSSTTSQIANQPAPTKLPPPPTRSMTSTAFKIPADKVLAPDAVIRGARLGSGGFGCVYRGRLRQGGRDVAVKQLHLDLTVLTSDQWNDMLSEIQAAFILKHPNLVEFIGILVEPHAMSIVTELCVNGSLFAALHSSNKFSSAAAAAPKLPKSFSLRHRVARQIFDALAFLHSRNPKVIHRDIKSLNVVLDANWNAKLCDFGLTTSMDEYKSHISLKAGAMGGSPRYMAPECFSSDARIDETVDVWSAGCLLIEIFGGPLPFHDCTDVHHIMKRLLVDKRPPDVPSSFPPQLNRIIRRCLQLDPKARTTSEKTLRRLEQLQPFTLPE